MKLEFEKKEKITSKDFKNQVYENKYIRKEKIWSNKNVEEEDQKIIIRQHSEILNNKNIPQNLAK